jgi:hypothetical protein
VVLIDVPKDVSQSPFSGAMAPEIELAGWTPARIAAELQGRLSGRDAGVVLEDLEQFLFVIQ